MDQTVNGNVPIDTYAMYAMIVARLCTYAWCT